MDAAVSVALLLIGMLGFTAIGLLTYQLGASYPELRFPVSILALLMTALVVLLSLWSRTTDPDTANAFQGRARAPAEVRERTHHLAEESAAP